MIYSKCELKIKVNHTKGNKHSLLVSTKILSRGWLFRIGAVTNIFVIFVELVFSPSIPSIPSASPSPFPLIMSSCIVRRSSAHGLSRYSSSSGTTDFLTFFFFLIPVFFCGVSSSLLIRLVLLPWPSR